MHPSLRVSSSLLFALSLALAAPGCSCGDGDTPPDGDGGPGSDASADDASADDASTDASPTDAGPPDAFTPECAAAADCMTARGAPPCGTWECTGGLCRANCPGCTDADGDGYGTGAAGACAGPDCDDADRSIGSDAVRSCYSGPAGTDGVGACRAGTETCAAGTWSGCSGEVVPGGEACNAGDDDCDGSSDESLGTFSCGVGACAATVSACAAGSTGVCTPGAPLAMRDTTCDGVDDDCDGAVDDECATCVHVAPTGNDAAAATSGGVTPFRTIQAAIDWAAADATRPRNVCVAQGAACGASSTYPGAVVMSDGISVYGGYESTGFTRCATSNVTIAPGVDVGVMFPASVTSPTTLSGFRVDRHAAATTAAVTVDGATGVTLADLVIANTPSVTHSYGVNLVNGAEALIFRSSIYAGNGTTTSIGVRSVGSTPTIRGNCQSVDPATGRCDDFCGATAPAIRGRFTTGTGTTYGVLLDASPGAVVEASAICGVDADVGGGIRVQGDATGTVIRGNLINAWGGATDSHGIWLEDCGGAAPWIVDNHYVAAAGDTPTTRVDGIRAIGDCHPVIDSNVQITGGGEGGTAGANGVYCGANAAGVASRCAVLGNLLIEGSDFGFPPTAVGVRCDDGGCLRIERNFVTGRGGLDAWGLYLGASGTYVDGNVISGGCTTRSAIGIHTERSFARIQNNFVLGFDPSQCGGSGGGGTMRSTALHTVGAAGPDEIDFHSNTLAAFGSAAAGAGCTAIGIHLDAALSGAAGPDGVFRNNVVRVGGCPMRFVVREESASTDPRVFESNDLDPFSTPTALYVDEGATSITMIAAVNALTDATFAGNVSVDPSFVTYPTDLHVGASSMVLGMGTAAGAPATDYDGDPRDPVTPDIGADER